MKFLHFLIGLLLPLLLYAATADNPTHIDDFNINYPDPAEDANLTDDYLRDIKRVLKTDFPSISGPVTSNQGELNWLDGITPGTAYSGLARALVTDASRNITFGGGTQTLYTLAVTAGTTLNGNVTLGSDASDNINPLGDFVNHLTPNVDNTYDIGTSTGPYEWRNLWLTGTANIDTLTLSTGSSVDTIYDEDALVSNDANGLATQQSIKAYVDNSGRSAAQAFGPTNVTTVYTSWTTVATATLGTVGSGNVFCSFNGTWIVGGDTSNYLRIVSPAGTALEQVQQTSYGGYSNAVGITAFDATPEAGGSGYRLQGANQTSLATSNLQGTFMCWSGT